MLSAHDKSRSRRSGRGLGGSIGIGTAAGVAAAVGVMFGRKAAAAAKTGKGHPLKHRVLDLAAGAMQPKYPLAAMSTYLNAFHMYADEMGRQVEASHFCIHLRHDLPAEYTELSLERCLTTPEVEDLAQHVTHLRYRVRS